MRHPHSFRCACDSHQTVLVFPLIASYLDLCTRAYPAKRGEGLGGGEERGLGGGEERGSGGGGEGLRVGGGEKGLGGGEEKGLGGGEERG